MDKPKIKITPRVQIEIDKYTSLQKIVEQLEYCEYVTKDTFHYLTKNVAFLKLKQLAEQETKEQNNG